MMPIFRLLASALLLASAGLAAQSAPFADPLDTPARMSPRAVQSAILGLAVVDADHVVGVGLRGHILRSGDRGKTWVQQASPVSTDLLAVQFPTPTLGWAVGHDGAVLRSTDGGSTWVRALDGRALGALLVGYYEKKVAADASPTLTRALADAKRMAEEGPTKPFLSVYFRDAQEGWLVGQFNLILHTGNGGATWEPWLDRTENPDAYSLNAIHSAGNQVYIVGELGLVLRLDAAAQRFRRIVTPYPGTWFGMVASPDTLIAVGLRGNAFRSVDGGTTWKALETGTAVSLNGGRFLDDGRLVLLTNLGQLLISSDRGDSFQPMALTSSLGGGYDIVAAEKGWLLVSGPRGVQRIALEPGNK